MLDGGGIVILARCHFIKEHEYLVYHPSNSISIGKGGKEGKIHVLLEKCITRFKVSTLYTFLQLVLRSIRLSATDSSDS